MNNNNMVASLKVFPQLLWTFQAWYFSPSIYVSSIIPITIFPNFYGILLAIKHMVKPFHDSHNNLEKLGRNIPITWDIFFSPCS